MTEPLRGLRVHMWQAIEVDVPLDSGLMVTLARADGTVTRTCKGCGSSVTSQYDLATGEVAPVRFTHEDGCVVFSWLIANPGPPVTR